MRFELQLTKDDRDKIRSFARDLQADPYVVERRNKNIGGYGVDTSACAVWRALISCLLTTQQRSGPTSKVAALLRSDISALDLAYCLGVERVAERLSETFARAGLRRHSTVAKQLASSLDKFSGPAWQVLGANLQALRAGSTLDSERACAAQFRASFEGIGPKQSRNLLQTLGLSRYIVPIDSRFLKHLTFLGFPMPVPREALQDEAFYCFIEDVIQQLAAAVEVAPCVYDAMVFASLERRSM